MKHIKNFENLKKYYYNVDDYILIRKVILVKGYQLGKIVSVYEDPNMYDIKFSDGWVTDISGGFIDRLLTDDEIKQYEAEKISKIYNI